MKKLSTVALILNGIVSLASIGEATEPTWNYAVQISCTVQASPPAINFSWPQDTTAIPNAYTVYRKVRTDSSWGAGTVLPGTATSFTDFTVSVGVAYEYQVVKSAPTYSGYGYLYSGINVPLTENRGKVVLIVDNTYAANLTAELSRLQQDLVGDGWTVLRHDVGRADPVASVKGLIAADYAADPGNVTAVFLFGHVPVPYSGLLNPDGHADHFGAWPADAFYGVMNGTWTDTTANYAQTLNTDPADAARLSNFPGDGKYDQVQIPSLVQLEVGRVDMANLPGQVTWGGPPTFPSEQELLRQYLNKDHNYRQKQMTASRRAVLADYFGVRNGEAFAASGFRNFASFFGAGNIDNLNLRFNDTQGVWVPVLHTNDYLWAYGCGAGSYTTIGGLGNAGSYNATSTPEIVSNDIQAVFVLLFGSWLGDWDHTDNLMRGVLATPTHGLGCAWSGRPHFFAHHMGLGETIGYGARLTQNNAGLYQNQINTAAGEIHVAWMGDPTLRLHQVAPPTGLTGATNGNGVNLAWTAAADAIAGYYVYRSSSPMGPFTRLTSSLVAQTSYIDPAPTAGGTYLVRAIKLETVPSGSYYNASQGAFYTLGTAPVTGGDTTPPTVSLSAPASGASLSGNSVSVTAVATDNVGVAGVQFLLDGANLGAEVTQPPYAVTWNTTTTTNGPHALSAVARDGAGNRATATAVGVTVNNPVVGVSTAWVDDSLPAGASAGADGGDSWNWVSSNPAPYSGALAHQSNLAAGLHEHYFNWATTKLTVNTGDVLFAYVYLDPANPPQEAMLVWNDGNSWEHRAYWGADLILYGTDGTAGRYYAGALPATGQWARLAVPASAVGLEGASLQGMGFCLFAGRATWDYAGSTGQAAPTGLPTATVTATTATATIGTSQNGVLTFSRSGSTAAPLTVNFALGGTAVKWIDYRRLEGDMPVAVTIPAGSAATTMTIVAVTNCTQANPETVTFTLSPDAAYTVGQPSTATVMLLSATSAPTMTVWVEDSLPTGASPGADGGDGWNWISSNPTPYSGRLAHQSNVSAGLHEHYFNWATSQLSVNVGDTLVAYVYLDPANPPQELMLSWNDGTSWEHRAYWGANLIPYGADGSAGRYYAGPLPATGQWVKLAVPASVVGLEGAQLPGMGFSLFGGRATWDSAGKTSP